MVADLDDEGLLVDLVRLEELLLTLAGWEDEAAGPDGDGWTPPGVLAGRHALHALNRIQRALRPTQTRTEHGPGVGERREVPPAGPCWYASNGRYELAALSFVTVAAGDVELLTAAAAELGRPGGDPDVREAIETHERDLPAGGTARDRERRGLVVTAARLAGLLDLEPTADTAAMHQAWRGAGGVNADRILLTGEQEAAYHRTVDRIADMATLSDPLTRWAMGTRDRH